MSQSVYNMCMNKKIDSPFSKVTSFVAQSNGEDFFFRASDDDELLLHDNILNTAMTIQRNEGRAVKQNTALRRRMRPIIGISGDSYWTLELVRRYVSNLDNSFTSISKILDSHMASFWMGGSDLSTFVGSKQKSAENLHAAYSSLRRLIYVDKDSRKSMVEFRVPDLTNSALPIWRTSMLSLFAPSLLTSDEILELWPLLFGEEAQELDGKNLNGVMHEHLLNTTIDFHKVNKVLLNQRKLLINKYEKENKKDYDIKSIGSSRFDDVLRRLRKFDDYVGLGKAEIDSFNERFKHLQEIANKQGKLIQK